MGDTGINIFTEFELIYNKHGTRGKLKYDATSVFSIFKILYLNFKVDQENNKIIVKT